MFARSVYIYALDPWVRWYDAPPDFWGDVMRTSVEHNILIAWIVIGLVHALLELEAYDDVLGHSVAGSSWEGFVIENIIETSGPDRTPYFYRTEDGAEVDLVLERGGRVDMAIEIKRTTAPAASRGFLGG